MAKWIMCPMIVFLLLATGISTAFAQSQPSAKATFAYDKLIAIPESAANCGPIVCSDSDGWTPVLTQEIRIAKRRDLFIDASLQCGLVTDLTDPTMNALLDSSFSRANISVRVAIYKGGVLVGYAQPDGSRAACKNYWQNGGVVFCDRIQRINTAFSGLNCSADPATHQVTCGSRESMQLILNTLNANSFNFIGADLDQGVYTVVVEARTSGLIITFGAGTLGATNAFIGAGSVAIEAVRMIKGEQVEF